MKQGNSSTFGFTQPSHLYFIPSGHTCLRSSSTLGRTYMRSELPSPTQWFRDFPVSEGNIFPKRSAPVAETCRKSHFFERFLNKVDHKSFIRIWSQTITYFGRGELFSTARVFWTLLKKSGEGAGSKLFYLNDSVIMVIATRIVKLFFDVM